MRVLALILLLVGLPVLGALPAAEAGCGEAQSCCCSPELEGTMSCCEKKTATVRLVSPCDCGTPHRPGSFTLPGRLDWVPQDATPTAFVVPVGPLVPASSARPESREREPEVPPPRVARV